MNDQTAKLLEQLAAKLGTTVEYLWSVLLRQAFVDAIISWIIISISLAGFYAALVVYKKAKKRVDDDGYWDDEVSSIVVIFCLVIFSFFMICLNLSNAIVGTFNPEFWAFDYIMKHL